MNRYAVLSVLALVFCVPSVACKGDEESPATAEKAPPKQVEWKKAASGEGQKNGPQEDPDCPGVEAAEAPEFEMSEEGAALLKKVEEAAAAATRPSGEQKVEKPPLVHEFYLLNDAYAATGYRIEALRRKIDESDVRGRAYVKLARYADLPETADIYDDMGNHLNIISYLWEPDFTVSGAVHKSASNRMMAMYLYCQGQASLYVHDLSTFRVHAPYARKVTTSETSVTVEFIDGHDLKGELALWPECEELAEAQEKAPGYQSPWGVHKEVYRFNEEGHLTSFACSDLKGELVEDIHGIAKKELGWAGGNKTEEAFYAKDGLLLRYVFKYDEERRLASRAAVDANGQPTVDYMGVAYYEFEYGRRGRAVKETRKNAAGETYEVHTFEYGKFAQVSEHKVLDGRGIVKTTFAASFNKKGARTELSIFDGDAAEGKLKKDFNGVAVYRFEYTDKGALLRETRHGTTKSSDRNGKEDYLLTNALDGWAILMNTYGIDDDGAQTSRIETARVVKVDQAGNEVFEEVRDKNGQLAYSVENTYARNSLSDSVKTLYERGLPTKKIHMDGEGKVKYIALLEYNSDGLLMVVSYYREDGNTPTLSADGFHKEIKTYMEDQRPKSEAYFDTAGVKLKTKMFEYDEEGKFKGIKFYDAEGRKISYRLDRPFPLRTVLRMATEVMQGQVGPGEERSGGAGGDDVRYHERLEKAGGKYGVIKLEYVPQDARVTIIQRTFCLDSVDDTTAEECAQPIEIKNLTHELKEGEELPYLQLENLPISERGMLCLADRRFYPESRQFCPGHEECPEKVQRGEKSEECMRHALASVQHCPRDGRYYVEEGPDILTCPDGETLTDPGMVPIFVHRYEFLFEREAFLPSVLSYDEPDWIHQGSGRYTIVFPPGFSLQRDWQAVSGKYGAARGQMRCWRRDWEDAWDGYKRTRVRALVREKQAEAAKKREEKTVVFKKVRAQYQDAVTGLDVVRRVKGMATIRRGMAEIFYYCPTTGKCDPARMPELKTINEDAYWGVLIAMGSSPKKWLGLDEYLATRPIAKVGLLCLQKWIPGQKEGQFSPMKNKECLDALEGLRNVNEFAYNSLASMFLDPMTVKPVLQTYKTDMDAYLQSVDDYAGTDSYEDLLFRIDGSGRFLEYLILAYLYDYDAFNDALIKYARSRQINYRRDAERRQVIPSDAFRGMKGAMEMAWWTGSQVAFDEWYYRLWAQDVQSCLLFVKDNDQERYEEDLKKFEDMVGKEKEGLRAQARGFKDFLTSLREFQVVRPQLKAAHALYLKDRKAFFVKYPESTLVQLQAESPYLYNGLLYLSNPRKGKAYFDEMSALPEVKEWETPNKPGDQPQFHKYLAYMDVFAPGKLESGLDGLGKRLAPMFSNERDYDKLRESNPDLPTYREAMRDIINNDIHLKYFWLLKLVESPGKFESEFSKLDLREAREVAKWVDPERYGYLADLVWLKEMVGRYEDSVPMLMDSVVVDVGLYERQLVKLKRWCVTKSKVVKKYRRGRRLAKSLLKEPAMVQRALEKGLKMANRFALLAKNLEDYEEAVVSTYAASAMEELRDEMDSGQRDSYNEHVETNNERIRMDAGFSKREWENVTEQVAKSAANAEWYSALSESLSNNRLDCRAVSYPESEGFKKWQEEVK